MADNSEETLIGMIRQRTEEDDLKQRLKPTVGGFTKSSVMEYLAEIRKQQQFSCETFNQNMQSLFEEKESLKTENEKLLMQIAQAKADFMRLAESRKQQEQSKVTAAKDCEEPKMQQEQSKPAAPNDNIVYLKSTIPATDSAKISLQSANSELEDEIKALKNDISEKETELEKSKQEIIEQQELLERERLETIRQRDLVAELSDASEKLQEELRFSEDKLAKLNDKVTDFASRISQQDETITRLTAEAEDKDSSIKTLLDENVTMMKSMELMSNSLDHLAIQNEKLLTANNALVQAYEDESKKVVTLINEKSEETVEKLILQRKLEELLGSISSYDLSKSDKSEALKDAGSKTSIA